jgi:hypothetical protein
VALPEGYAGCTSPRMRRTIAALVLLVLATSVRYQDAGAGMAGVSRLVIRAGAPGRIRLGAKGARLAPMALPLASPAGVTVELRRTDDAARCWGTTFAASRKNTDRRFVAEVR